MGTVIALIYMIALPFIVLGYYDCIPAIGEVINLSTISILMIYIPVSISETNTLESDAIASVAVVISSIMTVIILALAAPFSTWISPVFELPAVKTASNYI